MLIFFLVYCVRCILAQFSISLTILLQIIEKQLNYQTSNLKIKDIRKIQQS